MGLGVLFVNGLNLVPNPPARITAFTDFISNLSIYVQG
jgi:hypothetical protein